MMVVEEDKANGILHAVSDGYARKILASAMSSAKSVEEMSRENDIPISTCYRRVRKLLSLRLLKIERIVLSNDGKKYASFRSTLKDSKICVSLTGDLGFDLMLSSGRIEESLQSFADIEKKKVAAVIFEY